LMDDTVGVFPSLVHSFPVDPHAETRRDPCIHFRRRRWRRADILAPFPRLAENKAA
jgi:hypothetical protein